MARIKVSVVGLSYNGADILPPFIESVFNSSIASEVEVIIVDNASSDGTPEMIRKDFPRARLIARKKNIGSGALNDALKIAKGEYLFFTDSDMKFEKRCLENFYKTAKNLGEKAILAPTLYDYDDHKKLLPSYSTFSRSFYSLFVNPNHMDLRLKEVFMAGFVFLHRNTARKLKYIFDNDFFLYAEDFDLCLRMRLQGFKLYTCPEARMYNKPPSQTTRKYLAQTRLTYLLERNLLFTFFKICSLKTIMTCLPYVILMRAAALLRDMVTLKFRMAAARLRAYLWVPLNVALVLRKRRQTQKDRIMPDSFVFALADEPYFIKAQVGL